MEPSSRDRISVDLHGLKAALMERAKALGVSRSELVRKTLTDELGRSVGEEIDQSERRIAKRSGDRARLSLRMGRGEAAATLSAASQSGMSPGDYVAGLVAGVPVILTGGGRADHIATLVASNAELSALSRNIHQLTNLLRQGDVTPALVYRDMLNVLDADIRRHLVLAAGVLADLRPRSVRHARRIGPICETEGDVHGPSTEH